MDCEQHYTSLIVLGKELNRSVAFPPTFLSALSIIRSLVDVTGVPLKCRGWIAGPNDKHVGPRSGPFTEKGERSWSESLSLGRFEKFEIYDSTWANDRSPSVYASICKFRKYTAEGYNDRAKAGAESSVTLAIREDLANYSEMLSLLAPLAHTLDGVYGFVDTSDFWDYPEFGGAARTDLMDIRTRDIVAHSYERHGMTVDEYALSIFRANYVTGRHVDLTLVSSDPVGVIEEFRKLTDDRYVVTFREDPRSNPTLASALQPYFNLVPMWEPSAKRYIYID